MLLHQALTWFLQIQRCQNGMNQGGPWSNCTDFHSHIVWNSSIKGDFVFPMTSEHCVLWKVCIVFDVGFLMCWSTLRIIIVWPPLGLTTREWFGHFIRKPTPENSIFSFPWTCSPSFGQIGISFKKKRTKKIFWNDRLMAVWSHSIHMPSTPWPNFDPAYLNISAADLRPVPSWSGSIPHFLWHLEIVFLARMHCLGFLIGWATLHIPFFFVLTGAHSSSRDNTARQCSHGRHCSSLEWSLRRRIRGHAGELHWLYCLASKNSLLQFLDTPYYTVGRVCL